MQIEKSMIFGFSDQFIYTMEIQELVLFVVFIFGFADGIFGQLQQLPRQAGYVNLLSAKARKETVK